MNEWTWPEIIGASLAALAYAAFMVWAIWELVRTSQRQERERLEAREAAIRAQNLKIATERRIRPRAPKKALPGDA